MKVLFLVLALLLPMADRQEAVGAAQRVSWTRCIQHLDARTMTYVVRSSCTTYPIRRATMAPDGSWTHVRRISPHVRFWIRYPIFRSAVPQSGGGTTVWLDVTGYSWGCGAKVGNLTAGGHVPAVGTVASNIPWLWHRRIYVPPDRLHPQSYSGYVDDTGAPLDLFTATCQIAFTVTGRRRVIVY